MTESTPPVPTTSRTWPSIALAVTGAVAVLVLALLTIRELGGFDLMATVPVGDTTVSIANTFATVDHPFHATRADALLKSLQDGQPLRWIANHQGGYPVEFYPLGIAWLDVGLWALLLGSFPIIAVHKLAVLVVFVLPAIGFWILARGDRLNPFVPLLALAIQVSVPGFWTNGGYLELVEWGLVANVGGATLAFISFAALTRFVFEGHRWYAVLAIVSASAALYTNSRSAFAVATAAIAILVADAVRKDHERPVGLMLALRRIALVATLSALLSAPLLFAMGRYGDLYFFVHYMEYADFAAYWENTRTSVEPVFLWAAIAGIVLAFVVARLATMRATAVAVILFGALTLVLSSENSNPGFIQQLETPRLMPFQRLLVIYMAAATVGWVLDAVLRLVLPRWREYLVAAVLIGCAVVTTRSFDGAFGTTPVEDLTTDNVPTTGVLEFAQFSDAIAEADRLRPQGTAIYVVGDQESWWHEQLWAPTQSEAPFYYDDWMWYWHPDFSGPYNYNTGHYFPNPSDTFTPEWLGGHGVGVLAVTNMTNSVNDPRHAAESNPNFAYQSTIGYWDIYLVNNPVSIVTNGTVQPISLEIENETISATFEHATGDVEVRRNWFPRWEAYADGEQVNVVRTSEGFMRITVPDGTQEIELRYAVTGLDWFGRLLAAAGLVLTLAFGFGWFGRLWRRLHLQLK